MIATAHCFIAILRSRHGSTPAFANGRAAIFPAPCDIDALFAEAGYPDAFFLRNRENEDACIREERAFWVRFYALRLKKLGCAEFVEARAKALHEMTWLKGLIPYPDAVSNA